MGVDLKAVKPIPSTQDYFHNNWWYWRPLWNYLCEKCPDIISAKVAASGHYNDGAGLTDAQSVELSGRIEALIASGEAALFQERYTKKLDELPGEICRLCGGTGIRPGGLEQFGAAWFEGTKGCNGCQGEKTVRPSETYYPFDVDNLREFAEFCKTCGGFEIW